MRRNLPCEAVLPSTLPIRNNNERLVIKNIEVVTWMLGGGASTKVTDEDMPIRASAIRGQLRFWWRAIQAPTSPDPKEAVTKLRENENKLWGSTGGASKVAIFVEKLNKPQELVYNDKDDALPQYVLFPLRETKESKKESKTQKYKKVKLVRGLNFNLVVQCPKDDLRQVINTVRLWILFGGLGSRTRRGMGSLFVQDNSADFPRLVDKHSIVSFLQSVVPSCDIEPSWPSLIGAQLFLEEDNIRTTDLDALNDEWRYFIGHYRDFRQFRIDKYTGQPRRYGISAWPEPKTLCSLCNGSQTYVTSYPRGSFGLPIIFHFPVNMHSFPKRGEEYDFKYTCSTDRYASPVFVKIIKLAQNNFAKCCLLLKSPFPIGSLAIQQQKPGEEIDTPLPYHYDPRANPGIKKAPLNGKSPYDALFEFLGGAKVQTFTLGQGGHS